MNAQKAQSQKTTREMADSKAVSALTSESEHRFNLSHMEDELEGGTFYED
jgi:hypothetical protein